MTPSLRLGKRVTQTIENKYIVILVHVYRESLASCTNIVDFNRHYLIHT